MNSKANLSNFILKLLEPNSQILLLLDVGEQLGMHDDGVLEQVLDGAVVVNRTTPRRVRLHSVDENLDLKKVKC